MTTYILPIDILQVIMEYLDIRHQLRLKIGNKYCHNNLKITNMELDGDSLYKRLTSNAILLKYPYISRLDLRYNNYVPDLKHLKHVTSLDIGCIYIEPTLISHMSKIVNLNIDNNITITDISHFPNLKYLSVCGMTSIEPKHINECKKICSINVTGNYKIKQTMNEINKKNRLGEKISIYYFDYNTNSYFYFR